MSTTSAKCPQCGATARDRSQRSCEFCAHELPREKLEVSSNPSTAQLESRLRAIEASAEFQGLSEHVPSPPSAAGSSLWPLLFLVPWLLIGGFVTSGFYSFSPVAALFPFSIVAFGVIAILRRVMRPLIGNSGPVERVAAQVLDKRTEIVGGEHATTNYYVTLVQASGERKEFSADGKVYGTLAQADAGMAFARASSLLEFRRLEV